MKKIYLNIAILTLGNIFLLARDTPHNQRAISPEKTEITPRDDHRKKDVRPINSPLRPPLTRKRFVAEKVSMAATGAAVTIFSSFIMYCLDYLPGFAELTSGPLSSHLSGAVIGMSSGVLIFKAKHKAFQYFMMNPEDVSVRNFNGLTNVAVCSLGCFECPWLFRRA
jgi:hypothetical protein